MEGLARELRLKYRVFDLDDPVVLDNGLQGLAAVLHGAGPFIHTSKSVVDACLRSGVHYLDVMGEVSVFAVQASAISPTVTMGSAIRVRRHALPGAGCDVVPSDCLAGGGIDIGPRV